MTQVDLIVCQSLVEASVRCPSRPVCLLSSESKGSFWCKTVGLRSTSRSSILLGTSSSIVRKMTEKKEENEKKNYWKLIFSNFVVWTSIVWWRLCRRRWFDGGAPRRPCVDRALTWNWCRGEGLEPLDSMCLIRVFIERTELNAGSVELFGIVWSSSKVVFIYIRRRNATVIEMP